MPNDKLARLRAALIEGEQSGPPTAFDFDAFIARKLKLKKPALSTKDETEPSTKKSPSSHSESC